MALIEIRDLTKRYSLGEVEVSVLRGIDLEVQKGELLAIMGPSGSGKSTLMNVIGCLDVPTSGSYRLDGTEVSEMGPDQLAQVRNQKIGFVFQHFNLLSRATASENVELPLLYAGVGGGERKRLAQEALEAVGLSERAGHRPSQLSGGQQQRVAVARALVNRAPIILADEPTGNLDSRTGKEIMDLFVRLNETQGNTVIIVTHDPAIAAYCRRVVRVMDGKIRDGGAS